MRNIMRFNKKSCLKSMICLCVIFLNLNCTGYDYMMFRMMENTNKMKPRKFMSVELNSSGENKCSPRIDDSDLEWRGIVINAPEKVWFNRKKRIGHYHVFAAIPICGYYKFDIPSKPIQKDYYLFAKDQKNGIVYSGPLRSLERIAERTVTKEEEEYQKQRSNEESGSRGSVGGYFNPNLAQYVKLPEEAAVYDVYLEFNGFKSNTVTIELIEDK